jgi:hypothetical protein
VPWPLRKPIITLDLQHQSGHGNLQIDRLRRQVRGCLEVLYLGSRYWLDLGIFSEVYLGTLNTRGLSFQRCLKIASLNRGSIESWVIVSLHNEETEEV